ncbi:hypothetical protein AB0C84_30475 [Actinomadura sp. NPDC048955]|uniref:hypothetical protein n=1 Tax=Actinomadura sp. NPDC048955 TaxID=3158228 RepID=UPI0033E2FDEF
MTSNPSATSRNAQIDHEPEQLAEDLERAVRSLKQSVEEPGGLAGPATVYAVLDAVHTAATEHDQLLLHLERFLAHQHADGRLVRGHGGASTRHSTTSVARSFTPVTGARDAAKPSTRPEARSTTFTAQDRRPQPAHHHTAALPPKRLQRPRSDETRHG